MDQHGHIINEFSFDNDQDGISYLSSPFMDDIYGIDRPILNEHIC